MAFDTPKLVTSILVKPEASVLDPQTQEPSPAVARVTVRDPIAAAQQKQINAARVRKFADKVSTWLMPSLTIGAFLLIWEVISNAFPGGLPAPSMVLMESQELIFNPFYDRGGVDKGLFWHIMTSLSRVGIGFGLAAIAGVLLGAFIGTVDLARKGLDPIFQVFRTVPPLAWLPISLAALREAEPSALFVIFITSIWPIVINTAVGVRNIPQDYLNVAKVLRLHPVEFFFRSCYPPPPRISSRACVSGSA